MGSVVGGLYASGMSPAEMERLVGVDRLGGPPRRQASARPPLVPPEAGRRPELHRPRDGADPGWDRLPVGAHRGAEARVPAQVADARDDRDRELRRPPRSLPLRRHRHRDRREGRPLGRESRGGDPRQHVDPGRLLAGPARLSAPRRRRDRREPPCRGGGGDGGRRRRGRRRLEREVRPGEAEVVRRRPEPDDEPPDQGERLEGALPGDVVIAPQRGGHPVDGLRPGGRARRARRGGRAGCGEGAVGPVGLGGRVPGCTGRGCAAGARPRPSSTRSRP